MLWIGYNSGMNRRDFLASISAVALAGCATERSLAPRPHSDGARKARPSFHAFAKMFQPPVVPSVEKMCELMKGAGFDGIQWTVRKGGLVEPANAASELPRLCRIAESFGLANRTICTDITADAAGRPGLSPFAEDTLRAAADCGIEMFRPSYFFCSKKESFQQSFDRIRGGFAKLARLSEKTGVKTAYQNHTAWDPSLFGGVIWDIYACIRDLDPRYVGLEFDAMHACYEMNLSWVQGLELIAPWIHSVDLKDYVYRLNPKNPKMMMAEGVAAGEGVVPWGEVKRLLDIHGVPPLYVLHFEHEFDKTDLAKTVRGELETFRKFFA